MSNGRAKNILITGASGQLGQCIKQQLPEKTTDNYLFVSRKDLDIAKAEEVKQLCKTFKPDVIINTAAYTQVDRAEEERDKAYSINANALLTLAEACYEHHALLIHISTDYVFDGQASTPYKEEDTPHPQTVYGASKRKGEELLENSPLMRYYIIRTSWLYSEYGQNFYQTMQRLAVEKEQLQIVNDQYGCPTNANDLAKGILRIIDQYFNDLSSPAYGIYHFNNGGITTWYGFASEIFKLKNLNISVNPVGSMAFPTTAKRPTYSVLSNTKFQQLFDFHIADWDVSLKKLVKQHNPVD